MDAEAAAMKVALCCPRSYRNHQNDVCDALLRGLAVHGDVGKICSNNEPWADADVVCTWGWRNGMNHKARSARRPVLVMERAYVGDRFSWVSLGWDGLNGRAKHPQVDDGGERWQRHFAGFMKPWRDDRGGYALIIGQVPTDTACGNVQFGRWARETAGQLMLNGRRTYFRPHPKAADLRCGVDLAPGAVKYRDDAGLEHAFAGAGVVVTWNSNAGVLAALAGVPVVAMDEGSMAYAVASHDLANPVSFPDREAWAHRLAWCQWLPAELADGSAWEAVRSAIPQA